MADRGAKTGQTSPPAGTGFVPGLGEAFRINLSTGQGVYSYKLPLPDGVGGHTPALSLEYAHGVTSGPFGLGWRLGLRTIARRLDFGTQGGPDGDDGDLVERFTDSGAELMPIADGTFRAMTETSFARYRRAGDGWRIEERNGLVHELGTTAASRSADPDDPTRVHEWLLDRTRDPSGNEIIYSYLFDEGIAYPAEIRYAAYAVRFVYEDRPDVRTDGRMGFSRRRTRRGTTVELFLDPGANERRIRSWAMTYALEPSSGVSLLTAIRLTSHGAAADGSEDVVRAPVTFGYTGFDPRTPLVEWMEPDDDGSSGQPPALTDPDVALITLDNAPLPGVLQIRNGRQYYWPNRGDGRWGAPSPLGTTPRVDSFVDDGVLFIDADASGTADLVLAGGDGPPGYYENGGRDGWRRFVAYPRGTSAVPPWSSGRIRLTDIDGDGRIDAVESGDRAFAVWRNRGDQGWAAPLLAPKGQGDERPDVDFSDPLTLLADMNGDGLADLVRISSGRVEYWPSLGRGRFGDRVTMVDAPRLRDLQRSPQSVTLVDVDGDGCADLVRVTAEGAVIAVNRNGASFADPVLIDTVPAPIPGTLRAVNIAGRAGA
ncbi:MAG: VCBS repeat-containing protein, partial [Chloroflexia bacterium]|nr:VCBS repeat-containing protein [Chloroflexia bacterium]